MTEFQAAYWRGRIFKNTFTRNGQRTALRGWSVKIQHQGQRRTFSLAARNRTVGAREAWQLHRTILTHGWAAVAPRTSSLGGKASDPAGETRSGAVGRLDADHWKRRLLHRKHLEPVDARAPREFSVRIEHARTSHYFPLGTDDETAAAEQARCIYQTVVEAGWAIANEKFPRELTLALRWLDNPLAWTYTTFQTQKIPTPKRPPHGPLAPPSAINVAIIEPDAGIRLALADCANRQDGFRCEVTFASALEALREIPRHRLHLLLANHLLPDRTGAACLEELRRTIPHPAGLIYSVYRDSDELFRAAPGGAMGYLLKRTSPVRIFEPLAGPVTGPVGPLTREYLTARIREYFQSLFTALPVAPSTLELAKLTAREHEILTILSQGGVAKEIASTLGISIWTVHGHVKNIFEKLNVHTRTEAVVKFLQK